jgi:hypothetical protein
MLKVSASFTDARMPTPICGPSPLPSSADSKHVASNVIRNELDAEFVAFAHACLGFPAVSTLLKAAQRGSLNTFPRLTAKIIAANQPNAVATAQGHLDRSRQRKHAVPGQLTAPPQVPFTTMGQASDDPDDEHDAPTDTDDVHADHHNVFTLLLPVVNISHADTTGRFPLTSRRGFKYVLIAVLNG